MATATRSTARSGTFGNGMPYLQWGSGPRALVYLQGGPGSVVPSPRMLRIWGGMFRPYVDAGYTVWVLCRRRHMPSGHTISDMADDVADVIRDELGGRVDAVVGLSYGGLIAQYLAAGHPDRVGSVALIGAGACEIPDWVTDVDYRFADAAARGDHTGIGLVMAEYLIPGRRLDRLRRLLAPVLGRVPGLASELIGKDVPPQDLLVEARAEQEFNSRPVLPHITAPVLILARRERPIPAAAVDETASLIPDCKVIRYRGRGHLGYVFSRGVPRDVLAFLDQQQCDGRHRSMPR